MINVLFVCLGNICRSPLAEAVFKHKVIERGLADKVKADSAGTSNYHIGDDPDHRTIKVCVNHGIEIKHKGRQFHYSDREKFDYILAMDSSNHRNIIHEMADKHDGLYLMRDFDPKAKGADVPDPYYGGPDGFEEVYRILDRSLDEFLDFLMKKHEVS